MKLNMDVIAVYGLSCFILAVIRYTALARSNLLKAIIIIHLLSSYTWSRIAIVTEDGGKGQTSDIGLA